MATGREIYERAIALVDEINQETGAVDADTTGDYLARAPYLITILQTELMPYSRTRKQTEITCTGGNIGWTKADLPTDVLSIEDVVAESDYLYYKDPVWKAEQDGNTLDFYYDSSFVGKLRIIYLPVPTPVTDLDVELTIDDMTANLMAYGLAEAFINVEQNDFLQRIFKQKYDEQKSVALANKPVGMVKIVDVYGGV